MRRLLVLPQPLGPRSDRNSPFPKASDSRSTASVPPKRLVTLSRESSGVVGAMIVTA
jgi:hypothetical protein